MTKCKVCNKEYDESMDFVEDVEMLEALDFFVDIESICPDCLYKIKDEIEKMTEKYV